MSAALGIVRSVSSKMGTQREYETVMILRPGTNKNGILEIVKRLQGVFESQGARLLKIENWGLRTLAYPIKRNKTGVYMYWNFIGGSDLVAEIERILKITDAVIRFYTIRVDEDVDPNARPTEVTEDLLDAVSEPPEEPEEEEAEEVAAEGENAEAAAEGENAEKPAEAEAADAKTKKEGA